MTKTTIERVILAGGGTGGHLFPGIAVIEELRRRNPDLSVLYVGTEKGIESRVIPERGERLSLLKVSPLKGKTPRALVRSLSKLPSAGMEAMKIIADFRPDLVIGVGGYASGPMVASAAALRIPTAVMEQNAHVGLTNRLLAPVVGRIYLSFPESSSQLTQASKLRVSGNPVRQEFVQAARRASIDPEGFEARTKTLLVIGGSQGAKALNEVVPAAIAELSSCPWRIIHQTGESMRASVQKQYDDAGIKADVVSFIDDMAAAYSDAAVIVARAGATTLAELCAVGRPAVLVPYPHAADDHQTTNAMALQSDGAALCIPESELTASRLATSLRELSESPRKRVALAREARKRGRPDAAATIADDLFSYLGLPLESHIAPSTAGSASSEGIKRIVWNEQLSTNAFLREREHTKAAPYRPRHLGGEARRRQRVDPRPLVFVGQTPWK